MSSSRRWAKSSGPYLRYDPGDNTLAAETFVESKVMRVGETANWEFASRLLEALLDFWEGLSQSNVVDKSPGPVGKLRFRTHHFSTQQTPRLHNPMMQQCYQPKGPALI